VSARYAIYFAPLPGSELEAFGRGIVGRDHVTGEDIEQPAIDGLGAADVREITRSARHYGFHATLKAPFALRAGCTADDLEKAAAAFATRRSPFAAPPLQVATLSRWIALTLSGPCPEMDLLAGDCVRDFEPLRAPLGAAEIEKRRQSGLTPRQDEQLLTFGYPYIFEDFEFHMTLAGPLEPEERDRVADILRRKATAIGGAPLRVDAIALYRQPDRDSAFIQTGRFPFRLA
jgi:putative phosphonate metabolism protein